MSKQLNKNKNKNILTKERKHETMKTMRKLLAMALVLMLALTLVPTAFAVGTGGSLAIKGTEGSDVTYKIYKICDVEVVNSANETYKYKLTTDWKEFPSMEGADAYFTVNGDYLNWKSTSASAADGAAVAQLAKAYLDTQSGINHVGSATVNGPVVTIEDDGYYLLVPDNGTTCGVIVIAEGEVKTVTEKSSADGLPSVTKKVLEDSTNTYGEENTADIGERITFQTTITAGGHDSNYILHDQMCEHMLWLGGGNVTRDGNPLVRGENADNPGDYYVVPNPTDGCTFHVIFSESITSSLHKNATLVVNYYAVLEEDAAPSEAHINKTWLTHTAQNAPTNIDDTETYTYEVLVKKVDQDGNPLPGAEFVLKDNVNKYYKWGEITHGEGENVKKSTGVTWVSNIADATHLTSNEDGIITFTGVDAENFTLVETKVPGGYTGAGEVSVTTKAGTQDGVATIKIENVLGNALPETGGMGTTLFYLVGGLMVVAAVVLLVTKKRMRAAE